MEKKKVELFICPVAKGCTYISCIHLKPHEFSWCDHECVLTGRPSGSSICVPYELQIGDRVLVLESMRGVVDENGWDEHMKCEVGKEHVIRGTQDSFYSGAGVRLEGVGYYSWPVDHLQYVGRGKKEENAAEAALKVQTSGRAYRDTGTPAPFTREPSPEQEYTPTGKKLPLWELIKSSKIAMHELCGLAEWLASRSGSSKLMRNDIMRTEDFLDYALQHFCFKAFLLENEYIEVVKPEKEEVFYKTGDKFVYDDKTAVIVVQKGGNQMAGLVLQDGYDKNVCWSSFVPVADLDKITQEEFEKMGGVTPPSWWTKL